MKLNFELTVSNPMLNDEICKNFNKKNKKNKSSQHGLTRYKFLYVVLFFEYSFIFEFSIAFYQTIFYSI